MWVFEIRKGKYDMINFRGRNMYFGVFEGQTWNSPKLGAPIVVVTAGFQQKISLPRVDQVGLTWLLIRNNIPYPTKAYHHSKELKCLVMYYWYRLPRILRRPLRRFRLTTGISILQWAKPLVTSNFQCKREILLIHK